MAVRTAWWSRSRGLPRPVHDAWVASLAAEPARPARILAWARATDGYAVGSPAALSYGDEQGWAHVGWHEIEHGGWNADTNRLTWRRHDGGRGSVELPAPARLPELFRERVAASIALERFVPLSGERGVVVTARRDLGTGVVSWHSTLTRGLTWQTEGVERAVADAMAAVRSEYDFG